MLRRPRSRIGVKVFPPLSGVQMVRNKPKFGHCTAAAGRHDNVDVFLSKYQRSRFTLPRSLRVVTAVTF